MRAIKSARVLVILASLIAPTCRAGGMANWMASIDPKQSLARISIPGSHDSGATHNFLGLPETAKCQKLSIEQQLNSGIRFLDIRCQLRHGSLAIYHGCVNQQLPFETVEQTCVDFLNAHCCECIIMSIQNEGGPSKGFADAVDAIITRDRANWLTVSHVPTLTEARKKIVLLRRFDGKDEGIDATNWPDNETFPIVSCPGGLWVQDQYIVWSNCRKWRAAERFCQQAGKDTGGSLYLNFASGSNCAMLYPRICATAKYVNPRLINFFGGAAKGHYGVTIMDFVTPELCLKIIKTNPQIQFGDSALTPF